MATKMIKFPITFNLKEIMKTVPELKMSDIEMLREWCEKQAHFPKVPDIMLALFLHSNYYSMEAAKATAENYFTLRTHLPEFFCNRDPLGNKDLRAAFKLEAIHPLQVETKEGYLVYFTRYLDPEPSHFIFDDSIKHLLMVSDVNVFLRGFSKGLVFVADAAELSFGHVARFNPTSLKKFAYYIQEALPIRLKAIHILNAPPAAEMILNIAKPFLKAEILNMIKFHSSVKTLAEHVPIEALPYESGGKLGPINELNEEHIRVLENWREYFIEDESLLRVNEALRMGKSKTVNDLFGVEGSFKKLEID